MHTIDAAPVRKSITVRASPEKAFDVFVNGMGSWWIKDHSVTQSGQKTVVVEAVPGGRWYEIGNAGEECDWGRVIDCDRPHRIVFAWQLNADFDFDPAFWTEVEVLFEAKERARRPSRLSTGISPITAQEPRNYAVFSIPNKAGVVCWRPMPLKWGEGGPPLLRSPTREAPVSTFVILRRPRKERSTIHFSGRSFW